MSLLLPIITATLLILCVDYFFDNITFGTLVYRVQNDNTKVKVTKVVLPIFLNPLTESIKKGSVFFKR